MSAAERTGNKPLVFATAAALRQAAEVVPGAVIENLVAAAIGGGNVARNRQHGYAVCYGEGWRAIVTRSASRSGSGRKVWIVEKIQAAKPPTRGEQNGKSAKAT